MKLYIDTSSNQKTIVALNGRKLERSSRIWHSQVVLPLIDKLLRSTGKKLSDIKEIKVNTGPGSFTGLRVGVGIANALGWSLKVPVNGKKVSPKRILEPVYEARMSSASTPS